MKKIAILIFTLLATLACKKLPGTFQAYEKIRFNKTTVNPGKFHGEIEFKSRTKFYLELKSPKKKIKFRLYKNTLKNLGISSSGKFNSKDMDLELSSSELRQPYSGNFKVWRTIDKSPLESKFISCSDSYDDRVELYNGHYQIWEITRRGEQEVLGHTEYKSIYSRFSLFKRNSTSMIGDFKNIEKSENYIINKKFRCQYNPSQSTRKLIKDTQLEATCHPGTKYNYLQRKCVRDYSYTCPQGTIWNDFAMRCIRQTSNIPNCPADTHWDPISKRCVRD